MLLCETLHERRLPMPILLRRDESGQFLIIHATGKLVEADYRDLEPQFDRLAPHPGKLRVLFDMTGLHGCDAAAAWQDIKFDIRHFRDIPRQAMDVAEMADVEF